MLGFRDHSLYKGHQVFLYKRAQIFVADLWGAFKGQSYGEFNDIGSITIMADYIVPAVLQQLGVLRYSSTLASTIEANSEIGPGSEEEVELRACSVHAVEKMRELISLKLGKPVWLIFLFTVIFSLSSFICAHGRFLFSCPKLKMPSIRVFFSFFLSNFSILFPLLFFLLMFLYFHVFTAMLPHNLINLQTNRKVYAFVLDDDLAVHDAMISWKPDYSIF